MRRKKASECALCAWWRPAWDMCHKGHRPRFYSMGERAGWLRVCDDFKYRTTPEQVTP